MHSAATCTRAVFALLCFVMLPSAAAAQSGYIAGTVFGDIRQFGTMRGPVVVPDDSSLDATGIGGSLRVGTWIHPRWSLEVGADVGNTTTVEFENPVIIQIFPPPMRFDLKARTSFIGVSTMAGFHPAAIGRLRLGYLAGVSFVRATYKTDFPDLARPAPVFDNPFGSAGAQMFIWSTSFSSLPMFTRATLTEHHNSAAVALGFEAAIDLTTDIAIVPELRALAFSTHSIDSGIFLIRPGVGVRWTF